MTIHEVGGSGFVRLVTEAEQIAKGQRVPGLDSNEVYSELLYTLWRAYLTYDRRRGVTLGQWWWVLWTRRKLDLIEAFFALKRQMIVLKEPATMEELSRSFEPLFPASHLCPTEGPLDRAVWFLIGTGFTGQETRRILRISIERFYGILRNWRTPEVEALLRG